MKSKTGLLLAQFGLLAALGGMTNISTGRTFDPEEIEPKEPPIPNGCKKYSFYGHTVVAISEKSAIKKCKRLAGIK